MEYEARTCKDYMVYIFLIREQGIVILCLTGHYRHKILTPGRAQSYKCMAHTAHTHPEHKVTRMSMQNRRKA